MSTKDKSLQGSAGFYLKRIRIRAGISQSNLAKINGFSGTTLSKYERNKEEITLEIFLKICRSLGISDFNDIFEEEIEHNLSSSVESIVTAIKAAHKEGVPKNSLGIAISNDNQNLEQKNSENDKGKTDNSKPKLL